MKRFILDIEGSATSGELQEHKHEDPQACYKEMLEQQLQEVKAERDVLLAEKEEWEKEKFELRAEIDKAFSDATSRVRDNLKKYFSSSQVEFFLTGVPVKHWKEDDISQALTLRYLSPKAYRYLRSTLHLPYPSNSTLHRWVTKIDVEPGILTSVLNLLQHKAKTMTEWEKVCVLSFDEMNVASEWTYDKGTDNLYSPKSKVQCVLIRGLLASWKQIVFYDFDKKMTKDILLNLITKIESAGFHVVAMVSDLDASNVKLQKDLNIDIEYPFFTNPSHPDRQIHVFADGPHVIKLLRNHFLDKGYSMGDKNINSECVREIIRKSVRDLKTTHHLSENHVNMTKAKRMNVRLATQLMSETTAKSIQFFGEKGLIHSKDWAATSEFIVLVDSWFDVMNSKATRDKKQSRIAYGLQLEKQNGVLKQMISVAGSMRVCGHDKLLPFQKGLIMSSRSLQNLYIMLKEKYGITYLMTYRLNQDVIEHFFACLRQMGACYEHPSPVQVKNRIRAYILGKDVTLVGNHYNTQRENCDVSLTEGSFMTCPETSATCKEEALNQELCLTAMIFCISDDKDFDDGSSSTVDDPANISESEINFEDAMETEGLRYVGGYIARKFPQYQLGNNVESGDNTWIETICRHEGKLMKPTSEFFEKLKMMEKFFQTYHGVKTLKASRNSIKTLANEISKLVILPLEVITFFVRCRTFFRMRILNRDMKNTRCEKRKMKKLNALTK